MSIRFLAQTGKAVQPDPGNPGGGSFWGKLLALALILVLALPVTTSGAEEAAWSLWGRDQKQSKTANSDQARQVPQSRQEMLLSFSDVVKKTSPAVVNIYTKQIVHERQHFPGFFDDPFFQRFFGGQFPTRERQRGSLGSGVILTEDGLIVTNYHVIEGATEIKVVLADRREFNADLVLEDEATDLAVLRIDAGQEKLPTLAYQDSDKVEVGDLVLAIGNPFGVGQTVTSGIVSALARTHVGVSDYQFFIQTDAAINPGNSGGALVTSDGRLLGINTAIFSKSGGSVGIGFAIPANMVRTVVASAIGGRAIQRAWAGMTGQTLTGELAEGFGLDRSGGVLVTKTYPEGPADRAGLQKADVILGFNGLAVTDIQSLRFRIATVPLGQSANLRVWRNRSEVSLRFDAAAAPETPPAKPETLQGDNPMAGGRIANLSPSLAESLDMAGEWYGVVITDVANRSPARRLGLRRQDIILAVNGTEIKEVGDVKRGLKRRTPRWDITIKRNGQVQNVKLDR